MVGGPFFFVPFPSRGDGASRRRLQRPYGIPSSPGEGTQRGANPSPTALKKRVRGIYSRRGAAHRPLALLDSLVFFFSQRHPAVHPPAGRKRYLYCLNMYAQCRNGCPPWSCPAPPFRASQQLNRDTFEKEWEELEKRETGCGMNRLPATALEHASVPCPLLSTLVRLHMEPGS